MATGDVIISIEIEGGVKKTATLDSATRTKAKLLMTSPNKDLSADADWQIYIVNKLAGQLVNNANLQLKSETTYTAKTFTKAT